MSTWSSIPKAWIRINPPNGIPVPLSLIKQHARLPTEPDWTEDDALLEQYALTAETLIEEEAEVSLRLQTWRLWLPTLPTTWTLTGLPRDTIPVRLERPAPPNTGGTFSVVAVQYVDSNDQVVPVTSYSVLETVPPLLLVPSLLGSRLNQSRADAFQVDFTAGSPVLSPVATQLILLLVGFWYRNREAVGTSPLRSDPLGLAYESLLNRLRWRAYP